MAGWVVGLACAALMCTQAASFHAGGLRTMDALGTVPEK